MILEAIAGRFRKAYTDAVSATLTGMTSLRIAQSEAAGDELTRAGCRFIMNSNAAGSMTTTGGTSTIPTSTGPAWLLWNPNGNVNTMFMDTVGILYTNSGATTAMVLWACILGPANAPSTVPLVSDPGVTIFNANAGSMKKSKLVVAAKQTLLNTPPGGWFQLARCDVAAGSSFRAVVEAPRLRGRLIIPPGCGIALQPAILPATAQRHAPYAMWHEYPADLE